MLAIELSIRACVPASLALVLALGGAGCARHGQEERPMVQKVAADSLRLSDDAVKNLKLEKIVRGELPEKLSLMGKISIPEDRTVVVPSRIAGRTDAVFVSSGEVVRAGEPLCAIFSADFAVAREEYLQTLRQLEADPGDQDARHMLALSKRKLVALGVSPVDYAKWGTAADPKTEHLLVRAPRSGALLGKNAVIGSLVNVGDTLFMIGDLGKVWFAGDLYPEDLPKVHKNQEVVIEPGNGAPALHGTLSFISPVVDPASRTIKIRALMENPGGQLRADMYVQGDIIIQRREAVMAPKSALVRLPGESPEDGAARSEDRVFVFKRLPGNVFKKVPVTVDGESGDVVSIASGLEGGDEVVSEGGLLLDAALGGAGT